MQLVLPCLLPLVSLAGIVLKSRHNGVLLLRAHSARSEADNSRSHVVHRSPPRSRTVIVELENHKGVQYAGPIWIGDQKLMAIYDTGSVEIMAVSTHCSDCTLPSNLRAYDSGASSTFRSGTGSIEKHYYAGELVKARQDFDTVTIGNSSANISSRGMMIWQVMSTTLPIWKSHPDHCKFTTIFGLGHSNSVPDTRKNDLSDVQVLERVQSRFFTLCLRPGPASPGYVSFNPSINIASASFSSAFQRVSVIGTRHWAVRQTNVAFKNDKFVDRRCSTSSESCVAIIDSGTSLIGVPTYHYYGFIQGMTSKIKPDCSNWREMPDVVFKLGGQEFALPSSAYVLQLPDANGKKQCYSAFMPMSVESDLGLVWILGMPFLRHFYTVWDRKEPAIYMTKQRKGCDLHSVGDTSMFNKTETLELSRGHQTSPELTIADISDVRMPSWTPHGRGKIIL